MAQYSARPNASPQVKFSGSLPTTASSFSLINGGTCIYVTSCRISVNGFGFLRPDKFPLWPFFHWYFLRRAIRSSRLCPFPAAPLLVAADISTTLATSFCSIYFFVPHRNLLMCE